MDAYAYDPNAMYSTDPSTYYQYQQQYEANNVGELEDGEDVSYNRKNKKMRNDNNLHVVIVTTFGW